MRVGKCILAYRGYGIPINATWHRKCRGSRRISCKEGLVRVRHNIKHAVVLNDLPYNVGQIVRYSHYPGWIVSIRERFSLNEYDKHRTIGKCFRADGRDRSGDNDLSKLRQSLECPTVDSGDGDSIYFFGYLILRSATEILGKYRCCVRGDAIKSVVPIYQRCGIEHILYTIVFLAVPLAFEGRRKLGSFKVELHIFALVKCILTYELYLLIDPDSKHRGLIVERIACYSDCAYSVNTVGNVVNALTTKIFRKIRAVLRYDKAFIIGNDG